MTISWKPTCASTTSGQAAFGVVIGNNKSYKQQDILKMRPAKSVACWKPASITLGREIMLQPHMLIGKSDNDDSVAFTLYLDAPPATGNWAISYNVDLSFPIP